MTRMMIAVAAIVATIGAGWAEALFLPRPPFWGPERGDADWNKLHEEAWLQRQTDKKLGSLLLISRDQTLDEATRQEARAIWDKLMQEKIAARQRKMQDLKEPQ